jgi:hypothetical protein
MGFSKLVAKHLREIHFGGNWTVSSLKEQLEDLTWQEATTQISDLNTIATLAYHVSYYVSVDLKVLKGEELKARDKDSFKTPPIKSEQDWQHLKEHIWKEAEEFAALIEQLSDEQLHADFVKADYGNYYRNLHGIIEHMHYHLGQIAIIKKLIRSRF